MAASTRVKKAPAKKAGTTRTRGAAKKAPAKSGSRTRKAAPVKRSEPTLTADSAKLAARIVRLRDRDGKAWTDVIEAVGKSPSQVRRLYRAGGGKGRRA